MDLETFKTTFWQQGYCIVEDVFSASEIARLRATMREVEAGALGLATSNEVFDLEASHRPQAPRIRRIKSPHAVHPVFREFAAADSVLKYVETIIGPDIRLNHSKINQKTARYGSPLEWHQDWAFIPHTNQDLVITAVMLDDCTVDNGPVLYLPKTHQGRLHDHHHGGRFVGAIDVEQDGVDVGAAVPAVGRAGSVMFHHPMTIHGSALNRSAADRALLFYEYAAADAWPLFYGVDYDEFDARMVRGQSCNEPRMEPVYVRMPTGVQTKGLIYALQESFENKWFDTDIAEVTQSSP